MANNNRIPNFQELFAQEEEAVVQKTKETQQTWEHNNREKRVKARKQQTKTTKRNGKAANETRWHHHQW